MNTSGLLQSYHEALRASLTLHETRSIRGIMNTSGLLQSYREAPRASLTLQETRSIHDSMNIPKLNKNNDYLNEPIS